MKRFISILISVCVLLTSTGTLASTDKLFEALGTTYFSAEASTEFTVKLDSPLTFINTLAAEDYESISPVDFQALAESALTLSEKANSKVSVSEDFKSIKAAIDAQVELPLRFNDSLSADIWAQVGLWMDMDMTDINKPKYDMVLKLPFSTKYIVMDYSSFADSGVNFDKVMENALKYADSEYTKEINEKAFQLIRENSKIREVRNNTEYVITIDDAGIKAVCAGITDMAFEMIKEQDPATAETLEEEVIPAIEEMGNILNNIPILGKDGCKIKVVLAGGKLASMETTADICLNVYDIMAAMGEDVSEYERGDWLIDLTLGTKTTYSSLNGKIEIDMPYVDAANSINPANLYKYEGGYEGISISTAYPIETEKDKLMIPLRDCMNSIGIYGYSIDGASITVNSSVGKDGFEKVVFTENSDIMTIDGKDHVLYQPVAKAENGLVLIPVDAVEIMTDSTLQSVNINLGDGLAHTVELMRNVYLTEDGEAELGADYGIEAEIEPYVYEPSYYMSFYSSGRPVFTYNTLYLPARSFFEEMGYKPENMIYENGRFTIKSQDGSPKEFSELVIAENDNVIYVDGNKIEFSVPIIELEDTMYFPSELLDHIDCSFSHISYDYEYDEYELGIHRNLYDGSDYEDEYDYPVYLEYIYMSLYDENPVVKDESGYYLPLRKLMNEYGFADENITFDGETVRIAGDKESNGYELITLKGDSVSLDGEAYTMKAPLKEVNGSMYVPVEFHTDILGGKISSVDITYGDMPSVSYTGRIKNPMYEDLNN